MKVFIHEWVTGGGLAGRPLHDSLAREGGAMRRAVARDFSAVPGVRVVATLDDRFDEPDEWECVAVSEGRELDAMRRCALESDYTVLIAPETNDVLRSRAESLERIGARSLGAQPGAIAVTADKLIFGRRMDEAGVPVPNTVGADSDLGRLGRTFIVKPRDGAGCLDTRLVDAGDAATFTGDRPEAWVAQSIIPGSAMSASYLVGGPGSATLIGVGWQLTELIGRQIVYGGGRVPGPRHVGEAATLAAVRALPGLRGFVGVDFIHDHVSGRSTVIEVNPRVTTSFVGWQALFGPGVMAAAWLALARGEVVPSFPRSRHPVALSFRPDGAIEADP